MFRYLRSASSETFINPHVLRKKMVFLLPAATMLINPCSMVSNHDIILLYIHASINKHYLWGFPRNKCINIAILEDA